MTVVRRPAFLETPRGRLFMLELAVPDRQSPPRGTAVIVPAFAEEMNRSRRTCVLLAERLAQSGYRALLFDLSGTGDSDGAFEDARLAHWRDDVAQVADHARADGTEGIIWVGLRFGALLAAEAAMAADTRALVLWQPAIEGATVISQFRRLATAAKLVSKRDQAPVTAVQPVQEIAGYALAETLATDLAELRLASTLESCVWPLAWFEMTSRADQTLSPAATRVLKTLPASPGARIHAQAIEGPAFWSTTEITVSDALVQATTDFVTQADGVA